MSITKRVTTSVARWIPANLSTKVLLKITTSICSFRFNSSIFLETKSFSIKDEFG